MDKSSKIILFLIVIGAMILSFTIGSNKAEIAYKDKIVELNNTIDSFEMELYKCKLSDSLNKEFRKYAFYINKDSIEFDSRGYPYSKYHRKYKYEGH